MAAETDIREQQLANFEQEVVLETLARTAAAPSCRFLEVGSWCGHSTLILGRIARECGGHIFCVDWWKGNETTELRDIAARQDIFAVFWSRVCAQGLGDVVIPIRGRSEVVADILKENSFDLVFLDADHRYEGVMQDISNYRHFVRPKGGIMCGHDCEGYIADYDEPFLEAGKDSDYHEHVHCGVVLAVGRSFREYSINHAIWSARRIDEQSWQSTNLQFPGIADHRQPLPPPLASSKSYEAIRYGSRIYAIPVGQMEIVFNGIESQSLTIVSAKTLKELEGAVGEKFEVGLPPRLLTEHNDFNCIWYRDRYYGLHRSLGPIRIDQASRRDLRRLRRCGLCVVAASVAELKSVIDRVTTKKTSWSLPFISRLGFGSRPAATKTNV